MERGEKPAVLIPLRIRSISTPTPVLRIIGRIIWVLIPLRIRSISTLALIKELGILDRIVLIPLRIRSISTIYNRNILDNKDAES